ncbi:HlyD family efflux transporter periplasmic adaptor subunit [Novipirellula caenicola]|uniref:HlyD family secretion protein n=1 Tax=Novipirellula caenicola TaxID=1536901 RepID=A0ABP9VRB9_9BACT
MISPGQFAPRESALRNEDLPSIRNSHCSIRLVLIPELLSMDPLGRHRDVSPSPNHPFTNQAHLVNSATSDAPFVFSPASSPLRPHAAAPATNGPRAAESLVDETRREISEMVREIALAVRSERSRAEFLGMLADRILRAMAAEGVLIWQIDRSEPVAAHHAGIAAGSNTPAAAATPVLSVVHRIGEITDRSIPAGSVAAHDRMLLEVSDAAQPVVVPATPAASDPEVPANPTDFPAAVVPIQCDSANTGESYLLEVFLEQECGVATQRGYLRFVAQMADLAGEFLRSDQLRDLHRRRQRSEQVDAVIASIHGLTSREKIEARVVDAASDLFGFDRVGLCYLRNDVAQLSAVSYVNTIDIRGAAAKQMIATAESFYTPETYVVLEADDSDDKPSTPLQPRVVVAAEACDSLCLVGLANADSTIDCHGMANDLQRLAKHAGLAIRHRKSIEAIPGGQWLVSFANQSRSQRSGNWLARGFAIAMLTLIAVVALLPVPMVVTTPATLRPEKIQSLFASRSAIVKQIHVSHGDRVRRGQALLTMHDPELEKQITTLLGRHAVLLQKQAAVTTALVDSASHRDRSEQIQSERSLVAEELQAIDDQLQILRQVKESLVLRASEDGVVDSWQIRRRLLGRPVVRGDKLLEVIGEDTAWLVDARVPLSRIASVRSALKSETLRTAVLIDGSETPNHNAVVQQFGPSMRNVKDDTDTKAVVLRIENGDDIGALFGAGPVSGSPVRVLFRCETKPAIGVLFYDAFEAVRSTIGLYWSARSQPTENAA